MLVKTPITELVEKLHIANACANGTVNEEARRIIFINHFGSDTKDWKFDVVSQDRDIITKSKGVVLLEDSNNCWRIGMEKLVPNNQELTEDSTGLYLRKTYEPYLEDEEQKPVYDYTPVQLSTIVAYR